jgi:hypothetical protein
MLPYRAHDPRFERLVIGHVNLEKLARAAAGRKAPGHHYGWAIITVGETSLPSGDYSRRSRLSPAASSL